MRLYLMATSIMFVSCHRVHVWRKCIWLSS